MTDGSLHEHRALLPSADRSSLSSTTPLNPLDAPSTPSTPSIIPTATPPLRPSFLFALLCSAFLLLLVPALSLDVLRLINLPSLPLPFLFLLRASVSPSPLSTPSSFSHPPPLLLCSPPHLRPVARRLYHSTPVEYVPFASLPTLRSSSIAVEQFLSESEYNPAFPTQLYHNVCLLPSGSNHLLLLLNASSLNDSAKAALWLDRREQQALGTGERGGFLWQHYWWSFAYDDVADPAWRYLPGTTVVERKMGIYHGQSWKLRPHAGGLRRAVRHELHQRGRARADAQPARRRPLPPRQRLHGTGARGTRTDPPSTSTRPTPGTRRSTARRRRCCRPPWGTPCGRCSTLRPRRFHWDDAHGDARAGRRRPHAPTRACRITCGITCASSG